MVSLQIVAEMTFVVVLSIRISRPTKQKEVNYSDSDYSEYIGWKTKYKGYYAQLYLLRID